MTKQTEDFEASETTEPAAPSFGVALGDTLAEIAVAKTMARLHAVTLPPNSRLPTSPRISKPTRVAPARDFFLAGFRAIQRIRHRCTTIRRMERLPD